jgi:perosamine synthetase
LTNMIGSNYRLTEMGAAIGCAQLDRLDGYLAHRQRLAKWFSEGLSNISGLTPAKVADGCEHAYYLYPIKYDAKATGIPRNKFVQAVNRELPKPEHWEQTFLAEGYVQPLYLAPMYQKKIALGPKGFPWTANSGVSYSYAKGSCPVVERLYEESMIFTPLIREPLGESDIGDALSAIRKVIEHKREVT